VPDNGRALPEPSASPETIPGQPISPVTYPCTAGQSYPYGGKQYGEYYRDATFDGTAPGDRTVVRGKTLYYEIQMGLRIAYVKADDVDLKPVR
jgi:hypothetical protein